MDRQRPYPYSPLSCVFFSVIVLLTVLPVMLTPAEGFSLLHMLISILPKFKEQAQFLLGIGEVWCGVILVCTALASMAGGYRNALVHPLKSELKDRARRGFASGALVASILLYGPTSLVGLILVLAISGFDPAIRAVIKLVNEVPLWLAAPAMWLTGRAMVSWTNLTPAPPENYLVPAALISFSAFMLFDLDSDPEEQTS